MHKQPVEPSYRAWISESIMAHLASKATELGDWENQTWHKDQHTQNMWVCQIVVCVVPGCTESEFCLWLNTICSCLLQAKTVGLKQEKITCMNTLPGTESTVTPLITFAGYNTTGCTVTVNDRETPQVTKVKYLGVFLFSNSGIIDVSDACRKFCGQFNTHVGLLANVRERCLLCSWLKHIVCQPCCMDVKCGQWLTVVSAESVSTTAVGKLLSVVGQKTPDLFSILVACYNCRTLLIKVAWFSDAHCMFLKILCSEHCHTWVIIILLLLQQNMVLTITRQK